MLRKSLLRLAVTGVAALGLSACSTGYGYGASYSSGYGGYGYDGPWYGTAYDNYYGDPYGYRSVPYGYAGTGFGWSGGYYYPGNGYYVYDRRGNRRNWSGPQREYWQQRSRPDTYAGPGRVYNQPSVSAKIGASIAADLPRNQPRYLEERGPSIGSGLAIERPQPRERRQQRGLSAQLFGRPR